MDKANRLIVVKYISEMGMWIVDSDSQYILEGGGDFVPVQQLEIVKITPLAVVDHTVETAIWQLD